MKLKTGRADRFLALTILVSPLFFFVSILSGGEVWGRVPKRNVPDLSAPGQQVIKDDLGRPFPLPASPPRRIVSMASRTSPRSSSLGLGGRVVGVTRFCDWPPEAKAIPKIGGLVDPNVEIIRSLDPDLVIAFRGNLLRVVERIGKLGLPVFILDIGEGLDNLFPLIERIGRVTRTESAAAGLCGQAPRRVETVDAGLRGVHSRPRGLVLLYGQGSGPAAERATSTTSSPGPAGRTPRHPCPRNGPSTNGRGSSKTTPASSSSWPARHRTLPPDAPGSRACRGWTGSRP